MRLFTAKELARILDVRDERAYALLRAGVIPAVYIGRQVRVSDEAIQQFVESGGLPLPGGWRRKRPGGRHPKEGPPRRRKEVSNGRTAK